MMMTSFGGSRAAKAKKSWQKLRPKVERFFHVEDGLWHHNRIEKELGKAREISAKRRAAGQARWDSQGSKSRANAMQMHMQVHEQNDTQSQSQSQSQPQSPSQPPTNAVSSLCSEPGAERALGNQGIPLWLLRPPGDDWSALLFQRALPWLADTLEEPAAKLRSLVGRWLKAAGGDHGRVFQLIAECDRKGIADPRAYISAALKGDEAANEAWADYPLKEATK